MEQSSRQIPSDAPDTPESNIQKKVGKDTEELIKTVSAKNPISKEWTPPPPPPMPPLPHPQDTDAGDDRKAKETPNVLPEQSTAPCLPPPEKESLLDSEKKCHFLSRPDPALGGMSQQDSARSETSCPHIPTTQPSLGVEGGGLIETGEKQTKNIPGDYAAIGERKDKRDETHREGDMELDKLPPDHILRICGDASKFGSKRQTGATECGVAIYRIPTRMSPQDRSFMRKCASSYPPATCKHNYHSLTASRMLRCPLGGEGCNYSLINTKSPRAAMTAHYNLFRKDGNRYNIKIEGAQNKFIYVTYPAPVVSLPGRKSGGTFEALLENTKQTSPGQGGFERGGEDYSVPTAGELRRQQRLFPRLNPTAGASSKGAPATVRSRGVPLTASAATTKDSRVDPGEGPASQPTGVAMQSGGNNFQDGPVAIDTSQ